MKYKVESLFTYGWDDAGWTDDDQPWLFDSVAEAEQEIADLFQDAPDQMEGMEFRVLPVQDGDYLALTVRVETRCGDQSGSCVELERLARHREPYETQESWLIQTLGPIALNQWIKDFPGIASSLESATATVVACDAIPELVGWSYGK